MSKKVLEKEQEVSVSPVPRSTEGLCNALFAEMDALRNGTIKEARAHAMVRLTGQIINVARFEMDMRRAMTAGVPLSLGSAD